MIEGLKAPSKKEHRCRLDLADALAQARMCNGDKFRVVVAERSCSGIIEVNDRLHALDEAERNNECLSLRDQILAKNKKLGDIFNVVAIWPDFSCKPNGS